MPLRPRPLLLAFTFLTLASAGRAEPLLPWATGQTKGGIPVVAVGAPGAPWGVAQLHVRLAEGDMPAAERQSLEAAAAALADGAIQGRPRPLSADIVDAGGVSRVRVGVDHLVIADGAPMERFDVLLRTMDDRLRVRGRLVAATRRLEPEPTADPSLDPRAIALAAPGHPLALGVTGGAAEPPALRAVLDRILRRDRCAIVLVGPLPAPELLALAYRVLGAPLPPAGAPAALAVAPVVGTRIAETAVDDGPGSVATLWLVGPGRGTAGALPADRAARSVLARLVGGRVESTQALFAIAVDATSPGALALKAAEAARAKAVVDLGRATPPADALDRARTAERAARLERLGDPASLADALGQAALAGDPSLVEQELAALQAVDANAVAQAARAASSGPRVIVRVLGKAQ